MLTALATAAMPFHPGWGFGPGPFWIIPVVFWALMIALIVTLIVTGRRRGRGPWAHGGWASAQAARSAEAVLAERFARGDIEEVEYRARLEVLRSQQPNPPQG